MKTYWIPSLICSLCLLSLSAVAQDNEEQATDNASNSEEVRQARIQELRQLLREDRQTRRQDIERRLENLSEDERAALQERRQLVRQNQRQRVQRMRRQSNRCDCDESTSSQAEENL